MILSEILFHQYPENGKKLHTKVQLSCISIDLLIKNSYLDALRQKTERDFPLPDKTKCGRKILRVFKKIYLEKIQNTY